MSEEIQPVMTAEEWARELRGNPRQRLEWAASEAGAEDALSIPGLAALALQHAGPDGRPLFTWEDVDRMRDVADTHAAESGEDWHDDVAPLRDLAARLASLLPPREP